MGKRCTEFEEKSLLLCENMYTVIHQIYVIIELVSSCLVVLVNQLVIRTVLWIRITLFRFGSTICFGYVDAKPFQIVTDFHWFSHDSMELYVRKSRYLFFLIDPVQYFNYYQKQYLESINHKINFIFFRIQHQHDFIPYPGSARI
jgi:hypothetical protein